MGKAYVEFRLIVSAQDKENISDIIRDFKKDTSKSIIKEINNSNESRKNWLLRLFAEAGSHLKRIKHYKIWQDGNHPVELVTNKMLDQRLTYVHNNPVKQGVVYRVEDYCYGLAIDYYGEKGLLEIEEID